MRRRPPVTLLLLALARPGVADTLLTATARIGFFWSTATPPGQLAVLLCSTLNISLVPNLQADVQPVPPFYLLSAPLNGVPSIFPVTAKINQAFTYQPPYGIGTDFNLAIVDSQGISGGLVGPYTIVAPANMSSVTQGCVRPSQPPAFTLLADSTSDPCGDVRLSIKGGIEPYEVAVMVPMSGSWVNTTTTTSSTSPLLFNVVPVGQRFNLFAVDSQGQISGVTDTLVSYSSRTAAGCVTRGSTALSTGSIVGLVVGVVALILLLAGATMLLVRRRRRAAATLLSQQQQEIKGAVVDYRNSDGTQPLVEPFFTKQEELNGPSVQSEWGQKGIIVGSGRPRIVTSGLEPQRRRKIPTDRNSLSNNTFYGQTPTSFQSLPSDSSPTSISPHQQSSSTYKNSPYESATSATRLDPGNSTDENIVLANPAEFSFREPSSYAGSLERNRRGYD